MSRVVGLGTVDVPNKHILDYRWQERMTDFSTFQWGIHLPGDTGNPNLAYTLSDPKNYDLILESSMTEAILQRKYALVATNIGSPVMNQRLAAKLQALCPGEVQFFPVVIRSTPKVEPAFENHDYVLLNICHEVEALDMERTEFIYNDKEKPKTPDNILYAHRTCYKDFEDMATFGIARVKYMSTHVIISPSVAAALKKEKFNGLRL